MADDNACVSGYSVYISDRGGRRRVGEVKKVASITWGRVRDDTSQATVTISRQNCAEQDDLLNSVDPKRHEIVIYRGKERVWEGPVMLATYYPDRFEIQAHDIFEYIMARPLSKTWSNANPNTTEMTTRVGNILAYELTNSMTYVSSDGTIVTMPAWESVVPPANILPYVNIHHWPNEARTSATTTPVQMTVGEHIDNVAQTGGIDYTVVGRALHVWDTSRPLGQIPTLTEADFFGPIITSKYGSDFAAYAFTVAQDGTYGGAGENSDYYGPWAKIFTVYDEDATAEPTQSELNSQAQRNLSGRNPVPFEVRVPDNSTIRLRAGLGINDLVPGMQAPLRATLNGTKIAQVQKLDVLTVGVDSTGENIQVSFSPANKPDDDGLEG